MAEKCRNDVRTWARNAATWCGLGRYMPQRGAELGEKCRDEVRTVRGHGREMPQRGADLVRTWPRNAATRCGLRADFAEKCRNDGHGLGRQMPQYYSIEVSWQRCADKCGLGREMPQRGAGHGREMSQRWARPWPTALNPYYIAAEQHYSLFSIDCVIMKLTNKTLCSPSCFLQTICASSLKNIQNLVETV